MSDDRELLELAAKAAGYWSDEFNCPDKLPRPMWDPLEDDGDALRLMAKLKIHINYGISTDGPVVFADDRRELETASSEAWRRAIVYAAAQIGRAMP